jgi:hypothetical protein
MREDAAVKQTMLELMVKMMPLMMPLVYVSAALIAAGIFAIVTSLFVRKSAGIARLCGQVLVGFGVFFLACQAAGMWLGAAPSINFGDAAKFEFDLKPFWQIGLAALVPGLLIAWIGGWIKRRA